MTRGGGGVFKGGYYLRNYGICVNNKYVHEDKSDILAVELYQIER